jgi:hypothetical protein
MNYHYNVTVQAETREQADQVMAERLGVDENYGFDYYIPNWSLNSWSES